MISEITLILVVRNRPIEMVKKCLESVRKQTMKADIVVVDFGSNNDLKDWLPFWLKSNMPEAKLIRVERDYWSKQQAANLGFREVTTKYVMVADIDSIFERNLIDAVLEELRKGKSKVFVCCHSEELDISGEKVIHTRRGHMANTTIMAVDNAWVKKAGGMDEYYTGWGVGDHDFMNQAIRDGYKVSDIYHRTTIFHQWHEPQEQVDLVEKVKHSDAK